MSAVGRGIGSPRSRNRWPTSCGDSKRAGAISMTYTVVWEPSAQQDLARIWLNASDRNSVTAASAAIDTALRRDPLGFGESRSGQRRILFMPPLPVYYIVLQDDRLVSVRTV